MADAQPPDDADTNLQPNADSSNAGPPPDDADANPQSNADFPNAGLDQGRSITPRPNLTPVVNPPVTPPQTANDPYQPSLSPQQGIGLQILTPPHRAIHTAISLFSPIQTFPSTRFQLWGKEHLRRDFTPGTIFSAPLHAPDRRPRPDVTDVRVKWTSYGPVYTKLRKFVVISQLQSFCVALPLFTFQGRGLTGKNNPQDYCSLRDREVPLKAPQSMHPNLFMERNEDIKMDSGLPVRNSWHQMDPKSVIDLRYSVVHEYSSYCVIEGHLLEFSPFVLERPQDQITWLKWAYSSKVGSSIVVQPVLDANQNPTAAMFQSMTRGYGLDPNVYYNTSEMDQGRSANAELVPAGQVALPPTAEQVAAREEAKRQQERLDAEQKAREAEQERVRKHNEFLATLPGPWGRGSGRAGQSGGAPSGGTEGQTGSGQGEQGGGTQSGGSGGGGARGGGARGQPNKGRIGRGPRPRGRWGRWQAGGAQ